MQNVYGVCTCDNSGAVRCFKVKDEPEGLIIDDTGECETCQ